MMTNEEEEIEKTLNKYMPPRVKALTSLIRSIIATEMNNLQKQTFFEDLRDIEAYILIQNILLNTITNTYLQVTSLMLDLSKNIEINSINRITEMVYDGLKTIQERLDKFFHYYDGETNDRAN